MWLHSSCRRLVFSAVLAATVAAAVPYVRATQEPEDVQRGGGPPQPQSTQPVADLRFRYVGPPSAGRVASVAGVPGDPTT